MVGWLGGLCHIFLDEQLGLTEVCNCSNSAFLSLALALLTVSLFVYILLLPLIMGEQPNVRPLPHPRLGFDRCSVAILSRKTFWILDSIARGGSLDHYRR